MKKTIFVNRGEKAIVYDAERNQANLLQNSSSNIDWVYVIPEDCEVRYKDLKTNQTVIKQAKKNDILIQFYGHTLGVRNVCAIVKNEEWKQNVIGIMAEDEKHRTEIRESSFCSECCGCGHNIDPC